MTKEQFNKIYPMIDVSRVKEKCIQEIYDFFQKDGDKYDPNLSEEEESDPFGCDGYVNQSINKLYDTYGHLDGFYLIQLKDEDYFGTAILNYEYNITGNEEDDDKLYSKMIEDLKQTFVNIVYLNPLLVIL